MAKRPDRSDSNASTIADAQGRPALTIDYALYEKYLNEADLTAEQKQEFLDTLWSIIVSFVDLGFGVHPAQQSCGKSGLSGNAPPPVATDMIESSEGPLTREFTRPAAQAAREREES